MSQMEDGDVHQQLHLLRDRVNALTLQYSPRQAPVAPAQQPSLPPPAGDLVTAHLRDVKAHLNNMQESYSHYQKIMRAQTSLQQQNPQEDKLAGQSFLTLPSAPLFWELFNSLRADFQGLDTRVAGLEQDVDALEDRVDRLEPDRFTPPSSTTSQEDGGVHIARNLPENLLDVTTSYLPELGAEEQKYPAEPHAGPSHSRVSSLQTQLPNAFEWQWPSNNYHGTAQCLCSQPPHMSHDEPSIPDAAAVYPEGVAFRDREIDRMDDQLRVVQESLKSSEALAAAQDTTMSDMKAQIEALQSQNQNMSYHTVKDAQSRRKLQARNRELEEEAERNAENLRAQEEETQRLQQVLSDRDFAVRYWQERCEQEAAVYRHTLDDRDRAIQRWEESYNAVNEARRSENERAMFLSSKLEQYRSDRDQYHFGYNQEIDKLKNFCEHKNAVIVKQERVMSRGAQLLEERDAEIDRLQKKLRVAEDDVHHESRQQKRMARLLDETQGELERLRKQIGHNSQHTESSLPSHRPEEVMAASIEAVDGREPLEIPGSYPKEGSRASDGLRNKRSFDHDEGGSSEQEAARTGSPRRRRSTRSDASRHLPPTQRAQSPQLRDARPPPPPRPRPHHLPDRQAQRERFAADKPGLQSPRRIERRRARFLEDAASFPLPAPVSARKMASEADLRRADAGVGRALSRHQSMQELQGTRENLQPYVETEGESDAENERNVQPENV